VKTPIYETTTFIFESAAEVLAFNEGRSAKYLYSRYGNPTVVSAERKIAALDRAEAALVFSSGMAATATIVMGHVSAGDEVICGSAIYGGTLHLLNDFLVRFGITTRFVGLEEIGHPETVFGPRTRLLWFESPINPTLRCVDIGRIAEACRAHGVISVMDNTFASPINQQPLARGVDLSMQSATKYLNGHSDVTAGAVSGTTAMVAPIEKARRLLGTMAAAQMTGFGGMVCFDLAGDFERACRFYDGIELFKRAASLGGVESLVSLPVLTSQWGHTDEQLAQAGITRGMVRLSVGLEDAADLIADLDQALG